MVILGGIELFADLLQEAHGRLCHGRMAWHLVLFPPSARKQNLTALPFA